MTGDPLPPPRSTPIPDVGIDVGASPAPRILSAPGSPLLPPTVGATPWQAPAATDAAQEAAAPAEATTSADPTTGKKPRKPIPWWSGAIFACGVGMMLMPFVDPLLPRRSEPGRVTDTHIEKHRRTSNGRSRIVTDHITEGLTDDGESWDITNRDLYDDATAGDEVVVEFSRLSGNAVSVDGPGYRYDAGAGWARYVFLAAAAFFGVLTALVRPKGRVRRVTWAIANLAAFAIGGVIGLAIV